MASALFEIILIIVLVVANGIFSGSEIAIVSARKVRLEGLARGGDKKAMAALKLANSPNNFLSAVQIGITLIGILSGAVGGATLASRLGSWFQQVSVFAPYSEPLSLVIVVTLVTYLSLVIGELVPKRIALNSPEQIACGIAQPMSWLTKLTAPVVHLLGISTDGFLKLLGIQVNEEQPVTEEEIKVLIEQGARAGLFEIEEQHMVTRVFRLGDRPIHSVMTPRPDISWLNSNAPLSEVQQAILNSPYSRFPVREGNQDVCLGILSVKDFLTAYISGQLDDLRKLLQPAFFIPENNSLLDVLETFKRSGQHLALVVDEYGSVQGLVTLNDLTEAIVGNLADSHVEEPQIIRRDENSWLLDGLLPIDELKELLKRDSLPSEGTNVYHTIGGFITTFLGQIPRSGDYFEVENLRFEVVDMDGNRVDKVLLTIIHQDNNVAF